jgi:hypothetical protein
MKDKDEDIDPSTLVEWDGDTDPLDPRTFSAAKKWYYVAVISTGSLLVSVTSPSSRCVLIRMVY